MRYLLLACAACSFHAHAAAEDGPGPDAAIDAPPPLATVYFTAITTSAATILPGTYGIAVTAVLHSDLDTPVTGVAATLVVSDPHVRWRDADRREGVTAAQPAMVPPHGDATLHFVIDVLAGAAPPGPLTINGAATLVADGTPGSATPSSTPAEVAFETLPAPILVDTAIDEDAANAVTSLREAIIAANAHPGFDRIVFDPALASSTSLLDRAKGPFPNIDDDLVIDGNGLTLAFDSTWQAQPGSYLFRLSGGTLVVSGLQVKDAAYNFPLQDVSTNNCGNNDQPDGGGIRVDGGTLILDGDRFTDPDVPEKNCYAAMLRIKGGTGHRILHNSFTAQVMDTMYIDTAVREVSDNLMSATADPSKGDECVFVNSQGDQELWITGNTCVDTEYSGVIADGGDAGDLYLIDNTFVRTGRVDLGAVRRSNDRTIHSRNNLFVDTNPAAFIGNDNGVLLDLAYDAVFGDPLCSSCSAITPQNIITTDPMVDGSFAPQPGSPLIDSGEDWIDRNGEMPGRFDGSGTDRGAIEL